MITDQQLADALRGFYASEPAVQPDRERLTHSVLATIHDTPQGGYRWWPFGRRRPAAAPDPAAAPGPARGFTMLSALKYVAAGVIVALFGGFLLAGVLSTPPEDEGIPAAPTASPSVLIAVTSESTEASVNSDLLPGVALVTRQIEPGIWRVVSDGVRDMDGRGGQFIAGRDGSVWLLSRRYGGDPRRPRNWFVRLGEETVHKPPSETSIIDLEVGPDGTVWAVTDPFKGDRRRLQSHDGDRWSVWNPPDHEARARSVEVTSDGDVWASWGEPGEPGWREQTFVGQVGADTWQRVEPPVAIDEFSQLLVTDDGEPILYESGGPRAASATRYREGAWQEVLAGVGAVAVGPDGAAWLLPWHDGLELDPASGEPWNYGHSQGTLVRFGVEGRQEWGPDDGVPVLRWASKGFPIDLEVAPDGNLWVSHPLAPPLPPFSYDCEGVARFDGETWSRYLTDYCVLDVEVADDGTIWANGWIQNDEGNRASDDHTYVIRPDAVGLDE